MTQVSRDQQLIDSIAEMIWRSEYRRATGKERSVSWLDGIADEDKELYRYIARDIAAMPINAQQVAVEPTSEQVNSACLSYRHDFGIIDEAERKQTQWEAREWLHAWRKEGFGCDRDEVIERCAAVVDQCNREGPYQAIAAAPRIRALKSHSQEENPKAEHYDNFDQDCVPGN